MIIYYLSLTVKRTLKRNTDGFLYRLAWRLFNDSNDAVMK